VFDNAFSRVALRIVRTLLPVSPFICGFCLAYSHARLFDASRLASSSGLHNLTLFMRQDFSRLVRFVDSKAPLFVYPRVAFVHSDPLRLLFPLSFSRFFGDSCLFLTQEHGFDERGFLFPHRGEFSVLGFCHCRFSFLCSRVVSTERHRVVLEKELPFPSSSQAATDVPKIFFFDSEAF